MDWFFLSHRKDIAVSAHKNGWDVTIVTKDTGRFDEIRSLGLKAINLPINSTGMNPVQELQTLFFLLKLYYVEKPDIVHHVGMKVILWGTLAAKLCRISGIVNAVSGLGVFFSDENKGLLSRMVISALRFSHHRENLLCIFQNDDDKRYYVSNGIIKDICARFIKGSGVNLQEFRYVEEPSEGKIKICFTARMLKEKGVFILIEAANLLRNKYAPTAEFQLIGGLVDKPHAISDQQMKALCDESYIKWLGQRNDVRSLLEHCHIVAFPSYYMEGLPKSLIEACAVGRPIVTTDNVGCRDCVKDGVNGFKVPVKDAVALAEKLDRLISDKDLRVSMGQNSRLFAEKYFSLENVIKKHLEIYSELL